MINGNKIFQGVRFGSILVLLFFIITQPIDAAWQEPGCRVFDDGPNAESCRVSAPLNTSIADQTKKGGLTVAKLTTAGTVKVGSGNPGDTSSVNLPTGSISGAEIQDGTVTGADIQDGSIQAQDLASSIVSSQSSSDPTLNSATVTNGFTVTNGPSTIGGAVTFQNVITIQGTSNVVAQTIQAQGAQGVAQTACNADSGYCSYFGTAQNAAVFDGPVLATKDVVIQGGTVTLPTGSIDEGEIASGAVSLQKLKALSGSLTWQPAVMSNGVVAVSPSISVSGAAIGDPVLVSTPGWSQAEAFVSGFVDAANSVKIKIFCPNNITCTVPSITWQVRVLK